MLIKPGTKIYSSDDQPVGTLSHIILYPGTKEVTHLAAQRGPSTDPPTLIPIEAVYSADEKRIVLSHDAPSLSSSREVRHGGEVALAESAAPLVATLDDRPEGTV